MRLIDGKVQASCETPSPACSPSAWCEAVLVVLWQQPDRIFFENTSLHSSDHPSYLEKRSWWSATSLYSATSEMT